MRYILTGEGKIEHNAGTFAYQYFHKDHLGNTRVTYKQNGEVVQTADYYPFGMRHEPMALEDASQKYLYNGKELQKELGWYDYGARMYDPALGRWHVVDPMAEKYVCFTPYNYCFNNPINLVDPDGMDPDDKVVEKNKMYYQYQGNGVHTITTTKTRKEITYQKNGKGTWKKQVKKHKTTTTLTVKVSQNEETNDLEFDFSLSQRTTFKTADYKKNEYYDAEWKKTSSNTELDRTFTLDNEQFMEQGPTLFPLNYYNANQIQKYVNGRGDPDANPFNNSTTLGKAFGGLGLGIETLERSPVKTDKIPGLNRVKKVGYAVGAGNQVREWGLIDQFMSAVYVDEKRTTITHKRD